MGRLAVTDKPKAKLEVSEPRTRRRITSEEIEQGLGAERIGFRHSRCRDGPVRALHLDSAEIEQLNDEIEGEGRK
jgi:hypothetical protein